jgi:hypothetical protein
MMTKQSLFIFSTDEIFSNIFDPGLAESVREAEAMDMESCL